MHHHTSINPTLTLISPLFYQYFNFSRSLLFQIFPQIIIYLALIGLLIEPLKFRCHPVYKLSYTNFKFTGRHLGFSTSGFSPFGRTTLSQLPLDGWTWKHRYSRWNFVAILCTSWDKHISSLEAAILDFPLPVASGSFNSSSIGMAVYKNGE